MRIVCLTSCIVEFHNHCWKDFKSKYGEKTGDKVSMSIEIVFDRDSAKVLFNLSV